MRGRNLSHTLPLSDGSRRSLIAHPQTRKTLEQPGTSGACRGTTSQSRSHSASAPAPLPMAHLGERVAHAIQIGLHQHVQAPSRPALDHVDPAIMQARIDQVTRLLDLTKSPYSVTPHRQLPDERPHQPRASSGKVPVFRLAATQRPTLQVARPQTWRPRDQTESPHTVCSRAHPAAPASKSGPGSKIRRVGMYHAVGPR